MPQSKSKSKATDKYELVSGKILQLLERGTLPWRKPWFSVPYMNLVGGNLYKGRNPFYCSIDAMLNDWQEPYFVGFSQGQELGWSIVKGSKSTWIRFATGGISDKEVVNEDGTTETKQIGFHGVKWHNVFHVSCWNDSESATKIIDLVREQDERFKREPLKEPKIDVAEQFFKAQGAKISFGGNECFYSPNTDQIRMAQYEDFSSPEAYYSVLAHEHTHWTGHQSRMARDLSGQFGSNSYGKEELIAEWGAAFICNELHLEPRLEHHASYLEHWKNIAAEDPQAIFRAMDAAQRACDWMVANAAKANAGDQERELVAA